MKHAELKEATDRYHELCERFLLLSKRQGPLLIAGGVDASKRSSEWYSLGEAESQLVRSALLESLNRQISDAEMHIRRIVGGRTERWTNHPIDEDEKGGPIA